MIAQAGLQFPALFLPQPRACFVCFKRPLISIHERATLLTSAKIISKALASQYRLKSRISINELVQSRWQSI